MNAPSGARSGGLSRAGAAGAQSTVADRPALGDRGSVALIIAVFAVAMLAMAGLVIDGGAALAARGRAADLAQQASRAGADALAPTSLRGASPAALRVDPAAATRAATKVLTAAGAHGEVSVAGRTVRVTAHVARRSAVLSAFGVTDLTGTATATASLLYGTNTGTEPGGAP
jgi:Putative Flp pilus-assembly TadE/G-like